MPDPTSFLLYIGWHFTNQQKKKELISCDFLLFPHIRQRGDVGGSAKKVGKRIKELERIYGIKQGGSGFYGNSYVSNIESTNNSETLKTQEQLATQMGMSVDTLRNYKMRECLKKCVSNLSDNFAITCLITMFLNAGMSVQARVPALTDNSGI